MLYVNDNNDIYEFPFANVNSLDTLFTDAPSRIDVNNLVYVQIDDSEEDIDNPDYFLSNTRGIHIPLSNYTYDTDLIITQRDELILRSYNVRSIPKNLDLFLDSLKTNFDILCTCETRLNDNLASVYKIDDTYESFHGCRSRNPRYGGGVSLFIKSIYLPTHVPELSVYLPYMEAVAAEFINASGRKSLVISIYRPPKSSISDFISKMEELLLVLQDRQYAEAHIAGDLNIDLLRDTIPSTSRFVNLMNSFNFYCMINRPTRITPTSATLIDHIWSTNAEHILRSYIITDDITDHYTVEAHFKTPNSTNNP